MSKRNDKKIIITIGIIIILIATTTIVIGVSYLHTGSNHNITIYTGTESCSVVVQEYYSHGVDLFMKLNSGVEKKVVFSNLPIGTYMIIVTKDDFEAWETSVEITTFESNVNIDVPALTPIIGPCTPDCDNKECGSDGCGGSCGVCPPGYTCIDGHCMEE